MPRNIPKKKFAWAAVLLFLFFLLIGIILSLSKTKSLPIPPQSLKRIITPSPYPSEILDLTRWKLTLPVGTGKKSSEPVEIMQPELSAYQVDPWFMPTEDRKGVIFRAPVNAPTTGNSEYPRSELREMSEDGKSVAFWPSTKGTHTLFLDQAITAVPKKKKHVVVGQIHGDDDDLIVIRYEDPKLYITRSRKNVRTLEENYVLGTRFTIKFEASDGKIRVYYNGSEEPVYTFNKKLKMAYFKAGIYTQSNCETEESDSCSDDNYGEVAIYKLDVTHK